MLSSPRCCCWIWLDCMAECDPSWQRVDWPLWHVGHHIGTHLFSSRIYIPFHCCMTNCRTKEPSMARGWAGRIGWGGKDVLSVHRRNRTMAQPRPKWQRPTQSFRGIGARTDVVIAPNVLTLAYVLLARRRRSALLRHTSIGSNSIYIFRNTVIRQ